MSILRAAVSTVGVALLSGNVLAGQPEPIKEAQKLESKVPVSIEPQKLTTALNQWAEQTDMMVMVAADGEAATEVSSPVKGDYTPEKALRLLLARSTLGYEFIGERTVSVKARQTSDTAGGSQRPLAVARAQSESPPGESSSSASQANSPRSLETTGSEPRLEEIVVSAQKRGEERLQEVPVPVSVINADTLASNGQVRLREYFSSVPGLSMTTNYGGVQHLTIRGLSTGSFTNPVVGVTVDDVPFGASTHNGGGNQVPDFDPGDLEQIEVLRGPQGTLYGAASMGGLVRYVTRDPSFDGFSARIEASANTVAHSDQTGFNLRGSGNMPLGDRFAFRLSGYQRHDPGYVDNTRSFRQDVNAAYSDGARLSALWKPSGVFSAKFSALYQHTRNDGQPDVVTGAGLGDLEQNYFPPYVGWDSRDLQLYSVILNAKLAEIDVESITAYQVNKATVTFDRKTAFGARVLANWGVPEAPFYQFSSVFKTTQELRFSGTLGSRLQWMLAGFYTHERSPLTSMTLAASNLGDIVGREFFGVFNRSYDELAAFANLTYAFSDRFDLQVGGRFSEIEQTYDAQPVFNGTAPVSISPEQRSKNSPITYLVTPRFRVSPDLMVYARFASGYRPGGPNAGPAIADGAPSQHAEDKTESYELGAKGDFFEGRLALEASLYHIDWKGIQLQLRTPSGLFTYTINGAEAKSEGAELTLTAVPRNGTSIRAWTAYNDAVLTESFPAGSPAYGMRGDRLSFGARFSGHASIEQEFPFGRATGYMGGGVTYVGERIGQFQGTALRQQFPAYATIDFRTGVRVDSWTTNLYVNNVADKRGLIGGGIGYQPANAFIYIPPRTLGVSFSKEF